MQHNGFEYIDLGLPSGTLWAACNVGAIEPIDVGLYFQWGDNVGYTTNDIVNHVKEFSYDWSDYKFRKDCCYFTKYGGEDNKQVLDIEDDAANAYMGGNWRMPTEEEFNELKDECEFKKENGAPTFISIVNGNKLVFPYGGFVLNGSVNYAKNFGYIWLGNYDTKHASIAALHCNPVNLNITLRFFGIQCRGVLPREG